MRSLKVVFSFIALACSALAQDGGELCQLKDGNVGRCLALEECPEVVESIKHLQKPQTCRFEGLKAIVCCPTTHSEVGVKSAQQCRLNQALVGDNKDTYVQAEFPHLAALGFDIPGGIWWGCSGSLINLKYVLTAAHCLYSKQLGAVKYVRLGANDLNGTESSAQNFKVLRTIQHPDYKSTAVYHDLALIELDRMVQQTKRVRPACLNTKKTVAYDELYTGGWGLLGISEPPSNNVQKVQLRSVQIDDCQRYYPAGNTLSRGVVSEWQICAGEGGNDSCKGDSGGPLQRKHPDNPNTYLIFGVTSFSKRCGSNYSPSVYTRVSHYMNWIETIVWH
ncbi:PREDICTED: serine protease snake-like [Nicrophorus vespilloides]|uniref:Serine protease snake-like n=1 Tax=Nicrophorus vespilloides TaxID=110193 RepID=A0ABM1MY71_NICVS|nr:PREDICTED: serine protease snake-like [Nicrophorus vespilloides]